MFLVDPLSSSTTYNYSRLSVYHVSIDTFHCGIWCTVTRVPKYRSSIMNDRRSFYRGSGCVREGVLKRKPSTEYVTCY